MFRPQMEQLYKNLPLMLRNAGKRGQKDCDSKKPGKITVK